MISKELLSAVLGLHCGIKSIKNSEVIYWFDCIGEIREHSINIYELAHKCKEWASINSYALESSVHMQPKRSSVAGCQIHWRYETEDLPYFEAESEPEAIFKACQWILTKDSK